MYRLISLQRILLLLVGLLFAIVQVYAQIPSNTPLPPETLAPTSEPTLIPTPPPTTLRPQTSVPTVAPTTLLPTTPLPMTPVPTQVPTPLPTTAPMTPIPSTGTPQPTATPEPWTMPPTPQPVNTPWPWTPPPIPPMPTWPPTWAPTLEPTPTPPTPYPTAAPPTPMPPTPTPTAAPFSWKTTAIVTGVRVIPSSVGFIFSGGGKSWMTQEHAGAEGMIYFGMVGGAALIAAVADTCHGLFTSPDYTNPGAIGLAAAVNILTGAAIVVGAFYQGGCTPSSISMYTLPWFGFGVMGASFFGEGITQAVAINDMSSSAPKAIESWSIVNTALVTAHVIIVPLAIWLFRKYGGESLTPLNS